MVSTAFVCSAQRATLDKLYFPPLAVTEETVGDALLNDINLHMADQAGNDMTAGGKVFLFCHSGVHCYLPTYRHLIIIIKS